MGWVELLHAVYALGVGAQNGEDLRAGYAHVREQLGQVLDLGLEEGGVTVGNEVHTAVELHLLEGTAAHPV